MYLAPKQNWFEITIETGENMFQVGRSGTVESSTSPKTPAITNFTDATIADFFAVQQVEFAESMTFVYATTCFWLSVAKTVNWEATSKILSQQTPLDQISRVLCYSFVCAKSWNLFSRNVGWNFQTIPRYSIWIGKKLWNYYVTTYEDSGCGIFLKRACFQKNSVNLISSWFRLCCFVLFQFYALL